jgi:hypothetical protein
LYCINKFCKKQHSSNRIIYPKIKYFSEEIFDYLSFTDINKIMDSYKKSDKLYTEKYFLKLFKLDETNILKEICCNDEIKCYYPIQIVNYEFTYSSLLIEYRSIYFDKYNSLYYGNIKKIYDSPFEYKNSIRIYQNNKNLYNRYITLSNNQYGKIIGKYNDTFGHTLKVGERIDALDDFLVWYEAKVKEITDYSLVIHYCSWSSKYDKIIPKNSPLIAPAYSIIKKKRENLIISSIVEVLVDNKWYKMNIVEKTETDILCFCLINKKYIRTNIYNDNISPYLVHTDTNEYHKLYYYTHNLRNNGNKYIAYNCITNKLYNLEDIEYGFLPKN